jgi:hypothetical protein
MPRIADHLLDCSIYLYRSVNAAQAGEGSGGCGFFVHVPSSKHENTIHLYAVSSKHVIDGGFRVLRLNSAAGVETIPSDRQSWIDHPSGDDVSVLPIETLDTRIRWFSIPVEKFISRETIGDYRIGPGDETFLIGRLVTREGRQRNMPVVRFGNISMMADPGEPVMREDGSVQESFLVECRSLSGLSGSPVFVTTTQGYGPEHVPKEYRPRLHQTTAGVRVGVLNVYGTHGPWLLGINWGHIRLWRTVYRADHETRVDDLRVEANTGIACVVPAWRILEALNQQELVERRKEDDDNTSRRG